MLRMTIFCGSILCICGSNSLIVVAINKFKKHKIHNIMPKSMPNDSYNYAKILEKETVLLT